MEQAQNQETKNVVKNNDIDSKIILKLHKIHLELNIKIN
jgi:hypothetical protein